MRPERWQQITNIFEAALQRDASSRDAFVNKACADDPELRRQVEAMLASHKEASQFIEEPAMNVAARIDTGGGGASLVGQRVLHYQVLSLLGTGGMGEVYLAEDTKLDRRVALKLLPADLEGDERRVSRFQREARAVSALNHPNIITIHEIGRVNSRHFIATEFIEGETLRRQLASGGMQLDATLDVAIQVTSALMAAHEVGIVHRDIKPDNIMIRRDRIVKVLDFGLAKLTETLSPHVDTQAPTKLLVNTEPGVLMGTANYMSPEQARGLDVDARTDIWSLGIVLYEMTAGRVPFEGETSTDVLSLILQKEPARLARYAPQVPEELERIIRKCLEKDRERRYQSARELLVDLKNLQRDSVAGMTTAKTVTPQRRTAAHRLPFAALVLGILAVVAAGIYLLSGRDKAINSMAVLPFVNVGADPDTEYLSDGVTESLINNLSQLPNLKVIARSSVFRYKGREIEPQAVGRELGVSAVLTGRVIKRDDDVSISIELMDARDNSHIWGEQYSRKLADILTVQSEISREVTERLRLKLSGEEKKQLAKQRTEIPEAYQLYLRGRYHFNKLTMDDMQKGIEYFRQAVERDSNYALAYAGLADCYNYLGKPMEAKAAITSAIEIDDTLGEAHASLAFINLLYDWDWAGAEGHFKRGIELNPNYAMARHWYAIHLANMGRHDEAIREARRAQELDPLTLIVNGTPAATLYLARRYDQAIEELQKLLEMDANFLPAHSMLAVAYVQKGMYDKAIVEYQKVIDLLRGNLGAELAMKARIGHAYAVWGKKGEAIKILDELLKRRDATPYSIAEIYVGLGEKDRAFEWLEKAYQERNVQMVSLKVEPTLDSLRLDPRFTDLLRRMNLTP